MRDGFQHEGLIEHAWVEFSVRSWNSEGLFSPVTYVVDHTQLDSRARLMPAADYYKILDPKGMRRFTRARALEIAFKLDTSGPWPEDVT